MIIKRVKINDSNLRYKVNNQKISKIIGKKIKKIYRKSKYLIFELNKNFSMLVHLGMTGKFFYINKKNQKFKTSFYYEVNQKKDNKYDRVIFFFQNKQKLIYNDVRKFGFIKIYNKLEYNDNPHLKKLGPEPLEKNYNYSYLKRYFYRRKRSVKDILMDQKCVAGLGNIYVNEILFSSRIKPDRKVAKLNDQEIIKIIKNTKKILKNSIKLGGSSIRNFKSGDGQKGSFQQHFKVYGRSGKICSNTDCNANIVKTIISNRSTFLCNSCQK